MNYGYARVSSIGQKISGNSLEDQVSQLKAAGLVMSQHRQ
jgi:DNA invertase Pin-like site-specific DNA recombinase